MSHNHGLHIFYRRKRKYREIYTMGYRKAQIRIRDNYEIQFSQGDFCGEDHTWLIFACRVAYFPRENFTRDIIASECWPRPLNWYSVNRCQKHTRYCLNGLVSSFVPRIEGSRPVRGESAPPLNANKLAALLSRTMPGAYVRSIFSVNRLHALISL